jgi:hypothetical protein
MSGAVYGAARMWGSRTNAVKKETRPTPLIEQQSRNDKTTKAFRDKNRGARKLGSKGSKDFYGCEFRIEGKPMLTTGIDFDADISTSRYDFGLHGE